MSCPYCGAPFEGWRALHEHLAEAHEDAIGLTVDAGATDVATFEVRCPACPWSFSGRRDAARLRAHTREVALVAFDQLMMHWVEEHLALPEEVNAGGAGGDSERV